MGGEQPTSAPPAIPQLPPNVFIFTPKSQRVAKALLLGQLFTRLAVSGKTSTGILAAALRPSGEKVSHPSRNAAAAAAKSGDAEECECESGNGEIDVEEAQVDESFCIWHRNAVLIYDAYHGDLQDPISTTHPDPAPSSSSSSSSLASRLSPEVYTALQDTHHTHFRKVCLALKAHDITLDVAGCVFDAEDIVKAGFQVQEMNSGSVLVVDIVGDENDESESEDDDSGEEGEENDDEE